MGSRLFAGLLVFGLCACSDEEPTKSTSQATSILHDEALANSFFDAPFPSEGRRGPDGRISMAGYPEPYGSPLVSQILGMLDGATGFGRTSGVFFKVSAPLPEDFEHSLAASVANDGALQWINVDASSSEYLERQPFDADFAADGGPYGAENLLSFVPLQGIPLESDTLYAVVVTTDVVDASGARLAASSTVRDLAAGNTPDGMSETAASAYREGLAGLANAGIEQDRIAGLAVFRTGAPERELDVVLADALSRPLPELDEPAVMTDDFPEFCVYQSTLPMPVYQAGEPPYETDGGWLFDANGEPIFQRDETARIVITIPKVPMPASGFPVVLFSRTGGGGDRPLVDRGPREEPGGAAITPGTGPALTFARAGFAGVSIDGPHGGFRNVTGGDEQFLVFNVENAVALRDNVRQSALELALQAHILETLSLTVDDCPGAQTIDATLDTSNLVLMGHSMGATISPLTMAAEPRFRGLMLSGAGGSWIENVVYKQSPIPIKPAAELLIGTAGKYSLHRHDPFLSLFQWSAEPSDPPLYADRVVTDATGAPRHVLMMQGIVDTYIFPAIANATSLSMGLDLAGDALDEGHPDLTEFAPLESLLTYTGAKKIALPAAGNQSNGATAVVVQHAEDGIEDGHEVVFQNEEPKLQMRCFLSSLTTGAAPVVAAPASEGTDCP